MVAGTVLSHFPREEELKGADSPISTLAGDAPSDGALPLRPGAPAALAERGAPLTRESLERRRDVLKVQWGLEELDPCRWETQQSCCYFLFVLPSF